MVTDQVPEIAELVKSSRVIVVLQADNPDSDSLGSSLALEQILGDMGKQVKLYCGVDIPSYLKYMKGYDRVNVDIPKQFDLSLVVDASTKTLFDKLYASGQTGWLGTRPSIILDHHESTDKLLDFAKLIYNQTAASSTAEVVYKLAKKLDWPLNQEALNFITLGILGDTQGLSNKLATAQTYRILADMIEAGVNRSELEELRRSSSKMAEVIYRFKGDLIARTKLSPSQQVAYLRLDQEEINRYSPLYNPAPLIEGDMLQIEGVKLAVVFKVYDSGRITGAIRSNLDAPVAAVLAEKFGGGGHSFASGFKVDQIRDSAELISQCVEAADQLVSGNK